MAVRFLPPPEESAKSLREDRADLAEVIELRSKLARQAWNTGPDGGDQLPSASAPALNAGTNEQTGAWLSSAAGVDTDEAEPEAEVEAEAELGTDAPVIAPVRAFVPKIVPLPTALTVPPMVDADAEASMPARPMARSVPAAETESSGYFDDVDEDHAACTASGVKLMARKARSSGELREELLRLDHGETVVDTVIAEFEENLYLDDAGLARAVTEKLRSSKKASRSQIRLKLRERRLSDSVIETAVGELDAEEEFELLRDTARDRARKLGGLDRQTAERRLLAFLARRGWGGEPAMRAVRDALDGGGSASRGGSGVRFE